MAATLSAVQEAPSPSPSRGRKDMRNPSSLALAGPAGGSGSGSGSGTAAVAAPSSLEAGNGSPVPGRWDVKVPGKADAGQGSPVSSSAPGPAAAWSALPAVGSSNSSTSPTSAGASLLTSRLPKAPSRLSRNHTLPAYTTIPAAARDSVVADDPPVTSEGRAVSPLLVASAAAAASASVSLNSAAVNLAIDPLSQHIFMRTNTEPAIPQRLRTPQPRPDPPAHDGLPRPTSDLSGKTLIQQPDGNKENKRKGVSFLSRLSMPGRKRKEDDILESDSEFGGEPRTDGADARVFSSSVDAAGFIPVHKEPPRYIRTRTHGKKTHDFNRMFLAQELVGTPIHEDKTDGGGGGGDDKTSSAAASSFAASTRKPKPVGAIWSTRFSRDGRYLAAGGQDGVVRVWQVISTPEDRKAQEEGEEVAHGGSGERLRAPVFKETPIREFEDHAGQILDLSWSKNNFLLSTSMDKTVRLWHMSRKECLCTFKHKEIVSKVAFHPRDDRFFLAGSLDSMLRLWSIPDKAVAYSVQLPDLITAVAFTPDGRMSIAGMLNGLCMFYDTEGLKYQFQIHAKSSRGKNSKGSKITGIHTAVLASSDMIHGEIKVLISSNDSRVRLYNIRDRSLEAKFKGHNNPSAQISASFSDDGQHIISGSEDHKAFVWDIGTGGEDRVRPYECFTAHGGVVTTALFAPTQTRVLLAQSGDPIYDLCNPPPVYLVSRDEGTASQTGLSDADRHSELLSPGLAATAVGSTGKRPEESPQYLERSKHPDGPIIVTSDDSGVIKVFRQDCAFKKRRHESWDATSTISRKLYGHRRASNITRTSSAAHSRRGSVSAPQLPPQGAANTNINTNANANSNINSALQMNPDRILLWRQGIEGHQGNHGGALAGLGIGGGGNGGGSGSIGSRPSSIAGSARSMSPAKRSAPRTPLMTSSSALASDARKQPYYAAVQTSPGPGSSPAASPLGGSARGRRDVPTRPVVAGVTGATSASGGEPGSRQQGSPPDLASERRGSAQAAAVAAGATPAASREERGGASGNERAGASLPPPSPASPTIQQKEKDKEKDKEKQEQQAPPLPSFSFRSAHEDDSDEDDQLQLDPAGASYSFWNLNRWKGIAGLRGSISSIGGGGGTTAPAGTATSGHGHSHGHGHARSASEPPGDVVAIKDVSSPSPAAATAAASLMPAAAGRRKSAVVKSSPLRASISSDAAAMLAGPPSPGSTEDPTGGGGPSSGGGSRERDHTRRRSLLSTLHPLSTTTSTVSDQHLYPHGQRPTRDSSIVSSRLSSELTSNSEAGDGDDHDEEEENEEEDVDDGTHTARGGNGRRSRALPFRRPHRQQQAQQQAGKEAQRGEGKGKGKGKGEQAHEEGGEEEEEEGIRCRKCGSRDFRSRRIRGLEASRWVCARCGTAV